MLGIGWKNRVVWMGRMGREGRRRSGLPSHGYWSRGGVVCHRCCWVVISSSCRPFCFCGEELSSVLLSVLWDRSRCRPYAGTSRDFGRSLEIL